MALPHIDATRHQDVVDPACSPHVAPSEVTATGRLWYVCPALGRASEPWLLRQIRLIRGFTTSVVCWECMDSTVAARCGASVDIVPFTLDQPPRLQRWMRRVPNLRHGNFYAGTAPERKWLLDLGRRHRPDVMICHFGHVALRILPVADDLGIPLVAHFHGMDLSSMLKNRWYRWSLHRHLCSFAGVVVVGSRQQQWMLDQGVDPERVHLIPCGAPTDEFTPPSEQPEGPLRFVAVSRLVAWKGVDITIRALARTASALAGASLVIIGDGPDRGELETLAAGLGLADRVFFRGAQSPTVVRRELERSHVFVQHSLDLNGWYEGFGVSLAEAAAMGLPLVASRCGGIMDQVVDGQTGFLVDQHDVDGMAKAMQRLGQDPQLRRRFGQEGRRRVVQEFDTASQVRKLEGVLLRLAAGGS